jgi:hypothetical protein
MSRRARLLLIIGGGFVGAGAAVGAALLTGQSTRAAVLGGASVLVLAFVGAINTRPERSTHDASAAAPTVPEQGPQRRGAVEIVDAAIDPNLDISKFEASERETFEDVTCRYGSLDFKFLNRGDGTAAIYGFLIRVLDVQVNVEPVIRFSWKVINSRGKSSVARKGKVTGEEICIFAENFGWGDALDCVYRLTDPLLAEVFPPDRLIFRGEIKAGEKNLILRLPLRESKYGVANIGGQVTSNAAMRLTSAPTFSGPGLMTLNGSHVDENGKKSYCAAVACAEQVPFGYSENKLSIEGTEFRLDLGVVHYSLGKSKSAYAVILDGDGPAENRYPISRTIGPGGFDRFHVVITARKSGTYKLQLAFLVDGERLVLSNPFLLEISRTRRDPLPIAVRNGARFKVRNGVVLLGGYRDA